jgi:chaperone BCS1
MILQDILPHLKEALHTNQFLEGGAILGALAAIAHGIKSLIVFLVNRVMRVITYHSVFQEHSFTFNAVSHMIATKYSDKPRSVEVQSRKSDKGRYNTMMPVDDSFVIWHGIVPIIVQSSTRQMENAGSDGKPLHRTISLTTWFFRARLHALVEDAANAWQLSCDAEDLGWIWISNDRGWTRASTVPNRPISTVIGPAATKAYSDLYEFIQQREWYGKKGLAYKRGYLLWGPPGTGKTSLCKALASEFGLDICVLNLASLTDESAVSVMSELGQIGSQRPKILLIEDIDSYVDGRTVKKKDLRFSTLLNIFDGISSQDGTILIITTNHYQNLDPALIRPGRVDLQLEVGLPESAEIKAYLELFYGHPIEGVDFSGVSMSMVQETCVSNKHNATECIQSLKEHCNQKS